MGVGSVTPNLHNNRDTRQNGNKKHVIINESLEIPELVV